MHIVEKPWGRELWWARTTAYVGKILEIDAGHSLSLQYHQVKMESMYFIAGSGELVLGDRTLTVEPGLYVTIVPGTVHQIRAATDITVFEVSTPEVDDVVRLQDAYGRLESGQKTEV